MKALSALLVVVGISVRAFPLLDWQHRLLETFPTEDGYFMLTVGRNIGLGHGMSVAGGATPTNGVQPLVTLLWGAIYGLVHGDRVLGIFGALLVQIVVAALTAWVIYRLAERVLASRAYARSAGLLAAALWFASPVSLPHTMNCLETGFVSLVAALVALVFVSVDERGSPFGYRQSVAIGVLLGLAFWIRNDSVFLILAACLTYLAGGAPIVRAHLRDRFLRTLVFGATSVAVASPWLIHNYLSFGHIMPVSGRAESLGAVFGQNLVGVPIVLAETLGVVFPLPHSFEASTPLSLLVAAGLAIVVGLAIKLRRDLSGVERRYFLFVGIYALCIALFYGLHFGATWFLNRYVHPLSPLMAVITVGLLFEARRRFDRPAFSRLAPVAAAGLVAMVGLLQLRMLQQTEDHPHFQVVRWVAENVDDSEWVAAIQTGTLSYYHERTINLDGKVNVDAYFAQRDGTIGAYIAHSPAAYLVDWLGILDYRSHPEVDAAFEVLVDDPRVNLGVLRRIARAELQHEEGPSE